MSDTGDNNGRSGGGDTGGRRPLSLGSRPGGSVSSGTVKQSFSHGRTKTVVVETKRARTPGGLDRPRPAAPPPVAGAAPRPAPSPARPAPASSSRTTDGNLSSSEAERRQAAVSAARAADDQRTEQARREAAAARAAEDQRQAADRAAQAASAPPEASAPAAPQPAATPAPRAATPAAPEEPAGAFGFRGEVRREEAPRTQAPRREGPSRTDLGRNDSRLPEGRVYQGPTSSGPRPAGGGYGDRGAAPRGPYADRGPRPAGGADRAPAPRVSRDGDTVRYSAAVPRPSGIGQRTSTGPRPVGTGPGGYRSSAPSTPEVSKNSRTGAPRTGFSRPNAVAGRDSDDRRAGAPRSVLTRSKGTPVRREGRLTIQSASGESGDRMRSLASVRRAREREREKRKGGGASDQGRVMRDVIIPDAITVQELGQRMAVRGVDIIKYMMRQGAMMTINDVLDADTAELIASEFGHNVRRVSESDVEQGFIAAKDVEADTQPRPPVVAVMGHVDHGKTSLLDALRSTKVVKGEHGGITQHIGAYQVTTPEGQPITFLDTPGHAAFSAMRARGANVGDIVILVVAADDGVKPQTVEAINHAKAAGAPIIVAVNKIDKPEADPTKVVNELLQYEIIGEAVGGETQIVQVSATQKLGLDDLLEAINLQAEVMDLRANPDRSAEGTIIEAKLDKGRGPVATVIVDRGTLKRGDIVVAGSAWGKVRALVNERNEQPKEAGPSMPVEILGLDQAPSPGDAFAVVEDEARARELTEYRDRLRREKRVTPVGGGASLADMMAKLQDKKVSELPLIVKADVQGSAEAIVTALENLGNEEVRARIILSGAGGITESDVQLAKGAGCPILGFNVRASAQARALADREGVEIRYYAIIYDLLDDMKGVLSGLLSPIQRETWLGEATLLQVFDITKVGKIAGCRVNDGVVRRGARTRIIRNDVVIMEQGVLQTLKRFKDDVAEVISGMECGLGFQNFQDLKEGDQIECFTLEEVKRSL